MSSTFSTCFLVSTYGSFLLFMMFISCCDGVDTFGFNIHHRFSDTVKEMLGVSNEMSPVKGTMDYYDAMVHRDRFHGRRLASQTVNKTPLTFDEGNATFQIAELGFLYYANVSVGTPATWFLVALDTGSGLFWLPCDCVPNCVQSIEITPTEMLNFNIYSLSTSSTGTQLSCTSPLCERSCIPSQNYCPYRVDYLSANTSSSGYVVEDVIHLITDTGSPKATDVRIPFGCGVIQTGHFLEAGAPNGLFGLSMDPSSLPSVLASKKLVANSFSMCFGPDHFGRITFGDKGSKNQSETPVIPNQFAHGLYTVSITHVSVGNKVTTANLEAIFDTGTSFTLFTDPIYSFITEQLDSQVKDARVRLGPESAIQFCYEMTTSNSTDLAPDINLIMEGGQQFAVVHPWITISPEKDDSKFYCLAIIKSDQDINIIGENFMTGYRIVFDNEKPSIGWKASDCGEGVSFIPGLHESSARRSVTPSSLLHSYLAIATLFVGALLITVS